ncbi:deoxyribodipyrimidine photo-lyase [Candidatus Nomurabacteria bacterium]|nr:deoxyribodipyrimidine photo-lyase [Candidatus Nomurabacteria bacterium]
MSRHSLALNTQPPILGDCVLYFMSRDQRIDDNPALSLAQEKALNLQLALIVCFVLEPKLGHRSQKQVSFMLAGLRELKTSLAKLNIGFIFRTGDRYISYKELINELKPTSIFFDFSPLKRPRQIQKRLASETNCETVVVDAHNIIPCWHLSDKEEFAAYTIRHKVHKNLERYLLEQFSVIRHPYNLKTDISKLKSNALNIPTGYLKTDTFYSFSSGELAARQQLKKVVSNIKNYGPLRNDPNSEGQTDLSPYLHFGQISSRSVVIELMQQMEHSTLLFNEPKLAKIGEPPTKEDSINALIEEIVVRKELADNYCFYNQNYNNLNGAKPWALESLKIHVQDRREFIYELKDFEKAKTHDPAWNAAQNQMTKTGKMHGYMRMYWAKKILEWSASPDLAIKHAIYLNDKYSLDGGDPNGYAGIMWSIAGVHDRPWFDRPIYGQIRYMNYEGLKRKFNVKLYEKAWN